VTGLGEIEAAVRGEGLSPLGALRLDDGEVPGAASVVLVGMVGKRNWPAFAASPEYAEAQPHPLDRYSRRVVGALAERLGARALFPFEGPPYFPFQRWASRAGGFFPSPLGVFVHAEYGPWASFRGALAFAGTIEAPEPAPAQSPCEGCARPCLAACPVGAFDGMRYDVDACARYLIETPEAACHGAGCAARRACPVGREHVYAPEQARFYMDAFVAARSA